MNKFFSKKPIFLFILALFLAPTFSYSATFKNINDLNISNTESFEDNTYVVTLKNDIAGNFKKDLFIVSGNSKFTGNVEGDLLIIGGQVDFQGNVKGDLRVIGGEVKINGIVENDLVVIGGKIISEKNSQVKNQAFFIGINTDLKNEFNHPVKVISAKSFVDGTINSNIEVTTQNLNIGPNAKINNGISYYAPLKAVQESGSVINGNVNFNQISTLSETSFIKKAVINFVTFWLILKFITTLLLAFILVYIFRIFIRSVVDFATLKPLKSFLIGFLSTLIIPLIIVLLLISLIAMPIGFILLILFIVLLIIIPAVSGIILGVWIRKIFKKDSQYNIDFSTSTIGVILITFFGFIPYVGEIVISILGFISLGAVLYYYHGKLFKFKRLTNN